MQCFKCLNCGKNFISYPSKNQKFCSMSCGAKINSKIYGFQKGHKLSQESIKRMSETKRIYPDVETKCKHCQKEFIYRAIKSVKPRVFCSKECMFLHGARTGIGLSEESRIKLSIKYTGSGNPVWRGGFSKERNKFYRGRKYRDWIKSVFTRDNFTCQECGAKSGNSKAVYLEVHHIKPWAEFKDGWFNIDNGITLCEDCHIEKTKEYLKNNWKNQFAFAI